MTVYTKRIQLFPHTTSIVDSGLAIDGCTLADLAEQFGTPLYIYDQTTLDANVTTYRSALAHAYPGASALTLAGKAFLSIAAAQWALNKDLWLDCTGEGELHIAATAGAPRERILVHGVNKSRTDLHAAFRYAATIVVDNLFELQQIAQIATASSHPVPKLCLRVRPGFAVDTHAYRQTGQIDSKFGMDSHEVEQAVLLCRKHTLPLVGLHFHIGSHFHDPSPLEPALERILDLMIHLRKRYNWAPDTICPGGGWGVAYHEDELPHPSINEYVDFISKSLVEGACARELPLPALHLEPGRSLVAQAGVALYRVGTVKQSAQRRWYLIDGGMADNPRPALYGARYSALPVHTPDRTPAAPASIAGPYCESGDVLINELPLPDLRPGELLAIPVSGAYHLAMGSNYNGARKPAVVWIRDQTARLVQRRETLADLIARDSRLSPRTGE